MNGVCSRRDLIAATEAKAWPYPVAVETHGTSLLFERWRQAFAFEAWADAELVACLIAHPRQEREAGLFAHLLAAQWLWLGRMGRPAPDLPVWPAWSPQESQVELGKLSEAWRDFLGDLNEGKCSQPIRYTNSKGEPWESSVAEIVDHVLHHGSYHRGQITQLLRGAGIEPPYVDFIQATRTKSI